MRVLFYYKESEQIGIEYLSSILKKAGHQTDLIFDYGSFNKFGMVKSNIFSKTQNIFKLIKKAKEFNPDLIAFSSETDLYLEVKKMAYLFKKAFPTIPTIIGGKQATNLPEYVIKEPCFDILCRGEGEEAMVELVNNLEKNKDITKIKNLWVKKNGKIYKNELRPLIKDLDSLPFPDRELFYKYGIFKSQLMVICSRGCPHQCSYCNNSYYMHLYRGKGVYVRRRSVENIIKEIKYFIKKYPIKNIFFEDENFLVDKLWLKKFCSCYQQEINLPFICQGNPKEVDQEKIMWLKEAGCVVFFMGVESGNKRIRKEIFNRIMTNEEILKAANIVKNAKIKLECTAIFCSPTETSKEMFDTVELIDEIKPNAINTYTLYPYAKTTAFEISKREGYLDDENIKKAYDGVEGSHGFSILNHPYKHLAYNISKLLPLYIRSPIFLKQLIRKFMKNKSNPFVNFFFVIFLPFDYPYLAKEKIKAFLRSLF